MSTFKWIVMTKAVSGREADFVRWYDEVHIPDLLALDGFVSAQRYAIPFAPQGAAADAWQTMVIYELETDSLPDTLGRVAELMSRPDTHVSDAADLTSALAIAAVPASPVFRRG